MTEPHSASEIGVSNREGDTVQASIDCSRASTRARVAPLETAFILVKIRSSSPATFPSGTARRPAPTFFGEASAMAFNRFRWVCCIPGVTASTPATGAVRRAPAPKDSTVLAP